MQQSSSPDHAEIRQRTRPIARRFLFVFLSFAALLLVALLSPLDEVLVRASYAIPVWLALLLILAISLWRSGSGPLAKALFMAGVAIVIGGAAFDMIVTVIKTPTLEREANPIARALLDGGHSLAFVYVYSLVAQALGVLIQLFLWAAFLRHWKTVVFMANASSPRSGLDFAKAVTGGARLSWRQYIIPPKFSELPEAYSFTIALAFFLPGISLYRWYLGLVWLGAVPHASTGPMVGLCLFLFGGYVTWLFTLYRPQ